MENIRKSEYAPTFYNDEQALRYVIKFAYIVCVDKYMKVEELPSGKGIADVVFIPKKRTPDPAIIVELKWNKTADAAITQIKNRDYPKVLEDYSGEMILVGINYDDKTKEHSCKIEKISTER
ncbi:MAG: PD-(D/E)XK nuclease domain-containing protein [Oscillospiraceae bacterium]|nr:PD-(D/E)XK nuclease domain-containing protein [Oscillospiraceae bacterium]